MTRRTGFKKVYRGGKLMPEPRPSVPIAMKRYLDLGNETLKVQVRCCRALHTISVSREGRLVLEAHRGPKEREIAQTLVAFGGEVKCLTILNAWQEALRHDCSYRRKELPKALASKTQEIHVFKRHRYRFRRDNRPAREMSLDLRMREFKRKLKQTTKDQANVNAWRIQLDDSINEWFTSVVKNRRMHKATLPDGTNVFVLSAPVVWEGDNIPVIYCMADEVVRWGSATGRIGDWTISPLE